MWLYIIYHLKYKKQLSLLAILELLNLIHGLFFHLSLHMTSIIKIRVMNTMGPLIIWTFFSGFEEEMDKRGENAPYPNGGEGGGSNF